jgi:hypothetical protein
MTATLELPKRRRLFGRAWWKMLLIVLVVLLTLGGIAASTPLSPQDAAQLEEQVGETLAQDPTPTFIFANNVRIGLAMLIPVVGPLFGGFAIYQTGLVFAAFGISSGLPGLALFVASMLFPFFWLEFVAYAAAIGQSIFLLASFWRHQIRFEARRTAVVAGLVALLLFVGAFVEAAILTFFGQLG